MPRRLAIIGPYQAGIVTYDDPPLEAQQVLVRTELASGKHGTTMAIFDHRSFSGQRFDPEMRLFVEESGAAPQPTAPEYPRKMGTTGVGTVVAVGSAVGRWKVGDRVFGLMDTRETNICHEDQVWALGELDPLLALCIEPAYVSIHCVREAGVRYGDRVVVVGLGALGLLAVRMAREAGAETLIAIDPLPKRRRLAEQYGADHTLDPTAGDAALAVHRLTGGRGVDVAIELSGVYPGLQTAIRCARVGGTVCSAGFYQGEGRGLWLGREWHHNRLTMIVPHGCGWGHPPRDYPGWDEQRAYECIVSMMRQGRLTAPGLVNVVLSMEEATGVYQMIQEQPDEVIKYAVRFTPE